jgi:hypothetical protein
MSFGRLSAGLHRQDHPVVVGRILYYGGFAAAFARLDPTGLLYLKAKVQVMPHAYLACLRPSIPVEQDWLAAEYICSRGKNGAWIE